MSINFMVYMRKDTLGDLSGDDYLYPNTCFESVAFTDDAAQRLSQLLPHHT